MFKKTKTLNTGKNTLQPIIKEPKSGKAQAQFISSVWVTFKQPRQLLCDSVGW